MKRTHKSRWIIGIVTVLVLALGATAVFAQTPDAADSSSLEAHRGPGGRGGGLSGASDDTYLADALGITAEELEAAQENAQLAALEQAVDLGLITQEQADALIENGRLGFFGAHRGVRGEETGIDFEALFAAELGITVDELTAAREAAAEARVDQALADGLLTEEQVDLMQAREALKDVIDREALTATALGITVDELAAAHEAGTSLTDMLDDAGLTMDEFRTALADAQTAAINQAVADGVITQEQADLILSGDNGMRGFGGSNGRGGRGGRGLDGVTPDTDTTAPVAPLNTGSSI